jgi:RNA-directed DNA polymerase
LIERLNAKIKGWALYHRHASSGRTFSRVDHQIHQAVWRWCRRRHPQRTACWLRKKYFWGQGSRSWIFTGVVWPDQGRPYRVKLMQASDMRIRYHALVKHAANPYDPAWEPYYEARQQQQLLATLEGRDRLQTVYQRQGGRCAHCGQLFSDPSEWHLHHRHWRVHGGSEALGNLELLHVNCHRQVHSQGEEAEGGCVSRETFAKT